MATDSSDEIEVLCAFSKGSSLSLDCQCYKDHNMKQGCIMCDGLMPTVDEDRISHVQYKFKAH